MTEENKADLKSLYDRKLALEKELMDVSREIVAPTLARMVRAAGQIRDFGGPTAPMLAGSLVHNARCVDEVGRRLRMALGSNIVTPEGEDEGRDESKEIPLVLVLWSTPGAVDVQALNKLGLEPAFALGRWRPCEAYIGRAKPEDLVDFVLRYGGDVHSPMREKKVRGSKSEATS